MIQKTIFLPLLTITTAIGTLIGSPCKMGTMLLVFTINRLSISSNFQMFPVYREVL